MIQCTYKKNVNVELYQVYFDDRLMSGFGRRCYVEFYYLIINNTIDSINVDDIGKRLNVFPDSTDIHRISNDFIYREFQPWVKHLQKRDSVFLMKRIDLKSCNKNDMIKRNLTSLVVKSKLDYNPKVKYFVNKKLKYYFGDDRPYYKAKLDTLTEKSIDDDRSYYEGLRDEYLMFYNQ